MVNAECGYRLVRLDVWYILALSSFFTVHLVFSLHITRVMDVGHHCSGSTLACDVIVIVRV